MSEIPPNVVLILVDDADSKVLEHAACARIRAALLDEGATATRYLTTHPQCAPSRASLLRGMYPQNTGVVGNGGAYSAYEALENNGGFSSNIARWLKAAPTPYRTGMIGKFINGYSPNVEGRPDMGFDYWFGVGKGAYSGFNYDAWDDGGPGGAGVVSYGEDPVTDYLTDVLRRKASQFLDDSPTSEPFFLMVTPMAPHGPAEPHPDYAGYYENQV